MSLFVIEYPKPANARLQSLIRRCEAAEIRPLERIVRRPGLGYRRMHAFPAPDELSPEEAAEFERRRTQCKDVAPGGWPPR